MTNKARIRRHGRVRKKINGTPERPRLVVFRSNRHIEVQIIDDQEGTTLVSASTKEPDFAKSGPKTVEAAQQIGKVAAERAGAKNIRQVVFDRGGYKYHGKVKAVATGAREAGLEF